jgi:molybdopterin synthase sulfur carrier subunit
MVVKKTRKMPFLESNDDIFTTMAVKIRIPTTLRVLTSGEAGVEVQEGTVAEIFDQLHELFPEFRGRLLDEEGNLLRFVNIFVEDEDVRFLEGLGTLVLDGQTLSIVPAVAGG